jgi:hypothetical protein
MKCPFPLPKINNSCVMLKAKAHYTNRGMEGKGEGRGEERET